MYKRLLSFYSSFKIFCIVTTSLDFVSIYFPLFQLEKFLRGRMSGVVWFFSIDEYEDEDMREGSNPMQPCSFWALMLSTKIWFYVQEFHLLIFTFDNYVFMRFSFTQVAQVWKHYLKSFSPVKTTQTENVRFI